MSSATTGVGSPTALDEPPCQVVRRIVTRGTTDLSLVSLGAGPDHKLVVIKRLRAGLGTDRAHVEKFRADSRIAARLDHPAIVQVYEVVEHERDDFYIMEYVRGADLQHLVDVLAVQRRTLSLECALLIGIELCGALDYAHHLTDELGHARPVLHRQLAPSKVLVGEDGTIKLIGFSAPSPARQGKLARAATEAVGYLCPESCLGEPLDARSDVFALGVMLYELTSGMRLFGDATTDYQVMTRIVRGDVPRPSEVRRGYPRELENILLRALERDRGARYQTAGAMQRDLETFLWSRWPTASTSALGALVTSAFSNGPGGPLALGSSEVARVDVAAPPWHGPVPLARPFPRTASIPGGKSLDASRLMPRRSDAEAGGRLPERPGRPTVPALPRPLRTPPPGALAAATPPGTARIAALPLAARSGSLLPTATPTPRIEDVELDFDIEQDSEVIRLTPLPDRDQPVAPAVDLAPRRAAGPPRNSDASSPSMTRARPPATRQADVATSATTSGATAAITTTRAAFASLPRPSRRRAGEAPAFAAGSPTVPRPPAAKPGSARRLSSRGAVAKSARPPRLRASIVGSAVAGVVIVLAVFGIWQNLRAATQLPSPSAATAPSSQGARISTAAVSMRRPAVEPPAAAASGGLAATGPFDATPSIANLVVKGQLPAPVVRRGVDGVLGALRGCYRAAAQAQQRTPEVDLQLGFEIGRSGAPTKVHAIGGGALASLARCATSAVAELRTERPSAGRALVSVTIRYRPSR